MNFAKWTFRIAGIWGILVMPPFYFLYDQIGRSQPPAITHPEFYYGFVGVTLAWQFAFLFMSTDPVRYRPLMIPAMFEKFSYVGALAILHAKGKVPASLLMFSMTDLLLGILFVVSFFRTQDARSSHSAHS